MRAISPTRLIAANIVVDAFGTAAFMAGVGFFAVGGVGASPSEILNSLAGGFLVGVGLSLITAFFVDAVGARRMLVIIQVLQFLTYFGMLLFRSVGAVLALCAIGAALGRVTSPVRGALPPAYLDKSELLGFKSVVKVWTVIVTIAGGGVAAALGLLKSASALSVIPALNCASFVVAIGLTAMLPRREATAARKRLSLAPQPLGVVVGALAFALLIGLGSAPESAVAILAAHKPGLPTIVVGIAPALALLIAFCGQRVLKGRADFVRVHLRSLMAAALAFEAVAVGVQDLAVFLDLGVVGTVGLILVAGALAESALLVVTYAMWDVQYSIGSDADRGRTVGVFSVASSVGFALSPMLASLFFFKGSGISALSCSVFLVLAAAVGVKTLRRTPGPRETVPTTR